MTMLPIGNPENPLAQYIPQMGVEEPALKPPARKGGMFGSGLGIGEAIVHALNGYLAGRGNPVGIANINSFHEQRMAQQRAAQAEQQYQRQRHDQRDDFVFEQDYRSQHQAPDDFTQMMQAAGIDPHSDAGKALYLQAIQNKANPFTAVTVQNPDGSERREFMRPPTAPTAPVGNLRPLGAGGQTAPLSGPFPDIGPYHRY